GRIALEFSARRTRHHDRNFFFKIECFLSNRWQFAQQTPGRCNLSRSSLGYLTKPNLHLAAPIVTTTRTFYETASTKLNYSVLQISFRADHSKIANRKSMFNQ